MSLNGLKMISLTQPSKTLYMIRKYFAPWALFILACVLLLLIASCNTLTGRPAMVIGKEAKPDTSVFIMTDGAVIMPTEITDTIYTIIVFEQAPDHTYRQRVSRDFYESVFEGEVIKL